LGLCPQSQGLPLRVNECNRDLAPTIKEREGGYSVCLIAEIKSQRDRSPLFVQ
jgi:hypothetical protein